MKDYEPRQAGRVLADLSARHPNLSDGLTARRLEEVWMRLLGERARRYTVQVHFSRGVMTVEVSNDAWKNELLLERTRLWAALFAQAGGVFVAELRLF